MALDWPDGSRPVVLGPFTLAGSGHTALASAGVAVALRAATTCRQVSVKADRENVGTVYIGISTVTGGGAPLTHGFRLYGGDGHVLPETDLSHIFIVGANAGDGVSYWWWT